MTTSKQFQKIKNNNEVYDKEKERINNYIKNKYANNLEFREKIKTQSKERRMKLRQEKENVVLLRALDARGTGTERNED